MSDKAVDAFLTRSKFVPNCFVTTKLLEKLDDVVFSTGDIIFVDKYFVNVIFLITILVSYFLIDDPATAIPVRLMV